MWFYVCDTESIGNKGNNKKVGRLKTIKLPPLKNIKNTST